MSLKKQFLKSKPVCKVTFKLTGKLAQDADSVQLLGDFNQWEKSNKPMRKLKNGDVTETIELATGKEYQFKYLINGHIWENEAQADKYVPNEFQGENSVVVV